MTEKKYKVSTKLIFSIVFLSMLFLLFFSNLGVLYDIFKKETKAIILWEKRNEIIMPAEIEKLFEENINDKMFFININGLIHRIMGQKLVNGTFKDKNGYLNLESDTLYKFNEQDERKKSNKAIEILNYAYDKGANIIYVQRPWKNVENTEALPYGIELQHSQQFDYWCNRMRESNIPVLDLREDPYNKELMFYKTDHHWTINSAFNAAGFIIKELNSIYDLHLNENLMNKNNYNIKIYNDSFLGSEGIKTDKYYVGKDDFEIIYPPFKTNICYERYGKNEKLLEVRHGDFLESFVSLNLVEDNNYNNKYAAYMYDGYIENRICNMESDNNLKVLLISDSFSRPMATYFSLCFRETRYLDPQEGRYTESYINYIDEYEPDIVVMMFPGDGTFKKI